jgi:SulP family sulfate permease
MLIPQGMAYALLAGLPPQVGLYASMLPLVIYGLLGTSRTLAVGPVAIVSILTASGVGLVAAEGSQEYVQLALTLALLVGAIQAVMGAFRIGFLVNFLSHPVLVGFSAAAAIVIGFSQVKNLLGFAVPSSDYFYEQVWHVVTHIGETNGVTLAIGAGGIAILLFFKGRFGRIL